MERRHGALLAVMVSCGAVPLAEAAESVRLKAGQRAPRFLLPVMNSDRVAARTFKLADYVGADPRKPGRGVVLSFAASYCEPCREELAALKKRAEDLRSAGLTLAVVVIDTEKEGIEKMRRLVVDELDLPFPVLADRFAVVARRYGADVLPMSVVIDRNGVVKWLHSGFKPGTVKLLITQANRVTAPITRPSFEWRKSKARSIRTHQPSDRRTDEGIPAQ